MATHLAKELLVTGGGVEVRVKAGEPGDLGVCNHAGAVRGVSGQVESRDVAREGRRRRGRRSERGAVHD